MSETSLPPSSPVPSAAPRRGRRWWKVLLILVVLVVLAYFGITSQPFLKAVVLPRVGAALNAKVTVGGISLSPFSRVQLDQLRVETTGDQPLLRADSVTVRYRLLSLIGGTIAVPEVNLVHPEVNVVRTADGRSNLDPLLAGPSQPAPSRSRGKILVDLGVVNIRSGALSYCTVDAAGGRECSVITNFDLAISGVGNSATGKVGVSAVVLQSGPGTAGTPDSARGKLAGAMDFVLAENLMPQQVKGNLRLEFGEAQGAFRELAGWAATLDLELAPQELRQLALKFQRQGQALGEVRLRGPLDLPRKAGRVDFTLTSINRTALNLFGAPLGLDFGNTAIEGTGFLDLANSATKITGNLKVGARNFSVRQGDLATPTLDLDMEVRGNTDLSEQSAYLDRLSFVGNQGGRPLLSVALGRALYLSWRPGAGVAPPSAMTQAAVTASAGVVLATLTNLNLADWRPFLGTNIQAGRVGLVANITSSQGGARLTTELTNTIEGLSLVAGGTRLEDAHATVVAGMNLTEFRIFDLDRGNFTYGEGANELIQGTFAVSYDPRSSTGNAQLTANTDLPPFLARHPLPNLAFDRGSLRTSFLLNSARNQMSANITLIGGDVSGTVGGFKVSGYSAQFDAVGDLQRDKLSLRRIGLSAREGTRAGGSAELVGEFDGASQAAQLNLNVAGLNQFALRPFLAPWLTDYDLVSVNLDGTGQLRYNAGTLAPQNLDDLPRLQRLLDQLAAGVGTTTFWLTTSTTNLVVSNRATRQSSPVTGFGFDLDTTRRGDLYELGPTNRLRLPATPRAPNVLTLSGRVDLSATNPSPSTLAARSPGLDLTSFYDLAMTLTGTNGTGSAPARAPAAAATPAPETEPDPIVLPLRKLTADLQVNALYLHEMAISNWTAKAVVDNGRIVVDPFNLAFNNAAVTAQADLDLTRPGYVYDLKLNAAGIPLEPVVNSTAPEYQGKVKGNVFSQLQIAGAGITGTNLQRNLRGTVHLSCTNLNFEIVTPRTKRLLTTLATAFRIQDLAKAPLTLLATDIVITNGSVNVQPFTAASDAFFATAEGAIRLAPVLTNSTVNLPVQFALRQDLARQIKLANLTASSRSNYLALPPLIRLAGTVGVPETEVDKVRLAALLAGSLGGAIGGQTGTALEGVNSLLQGNTQGALGSLNNLLQRQGATNAPAPTTNAPASQAPSSQTTTAIQGVNSLLQGDTQGALGSLGGLLQRPRTGSTNPPAGAAPRTGTNAPTPAAPGK